MASAAAAAAQVASFPAFAVVAVYDPSRLFRGTVVTCRLGFFGCRASFLSAFCYFPDGCRLPFGLASQG